jgi:hypothetical protein
MDLSSVRRLGKQPYETVREQFGQLGEHVIARHWDADAPVRLGYRKFLGALDELAGRLLDDGEIAQRGQDLLRETEAERTAQPDGASGAGETAEATETGTGAEAATETGESVWTQASDDVTPGAGASGGATGAEAAAGAGAAGAGAAEAGAAEAAGGTAGSETAGGAVGVDEPGPVRAAGAPVDAGRTVDVVFSLPAEVEAERVTLCGEFNDWSPESIVLARGDDRSWRVTVPLAPGSYRYKYLLDGETWENGPDADRYEENAYGTVDSVIAVG